MALITKAIKGTQDTLPMDSMLRFEVGQKYAIEKELCNSSSALRQAQGPKTYYNWKAAFDECKVEGATGAKNQLHALMCSIEQCNGAGDCRKSNLIGGTLCPAFKVSGDETKATRSRANVLREILTRGWGSEAFAQALDKDKSILKSKELAEVLDSCLACKGCRSECPSNVDMTRLRSEILQHKYDVGRMPLRSFAVSRMATVEQFGHLVWPFYNLFASWKFSSNIINNLLTLFNRQLDIRIITVNQVLVSRR